MRASDDEVARLIRSQSGELTRNVSRDLSEQDWYAALDADVRASLNLVLDQSVVAFAQWLGSGRDPGVAQAALQGTHRQITAHLDLERSVALVQHASTVMSGLVPDLVASEDREWVSRDITLFTREVAFAVALAYARVAEQQGSIDARHQAHLMDLLLEGAAAEALLAAAGALGWTGDEEFEVMAGRRRRDHDPIAAATTAARAQRVRWVAGLRGDHLVLVSLVDRSRPDDSATAAARLVDGVLVRGAGTSGLVSVPASLAAVMSAANAVDLRLECPEVVTPDDLLPERVLLGDAAAVDELVRRCYRPLSKVGEHLIGTTIAYLSSFGRLQETARFLHVHPNTVRYRLGRVEELTGQDPRAARGALTLHLAIVLGGAREAARIP